MVRKVQNALKLQKAGFDTTSVSGRAVKYFNDPQKSWEEAETACNTVVPSLKGNLLTANNAEVYDWLKQLAANDRIWIGLNDKVSL